MKVLMRSCFIIVLLSVSLESMSQSKVDTKGDTTLYFYGNFEIENGLQVLTDTDSVTIPKANVISSLSGLRVMNTQLMLRVAKAQMGVETLRLKNPSQTNLVRFYGTDLEMQEALNLLKRSYKNSLYYLRDFEFYKDVKSQGPDNPIIK